MTGCIRLTVLQVAVLLTAQAQAPPAPEMPRVRQGEVLRVNWNGDSTPSRLGWGTVSVPFFPNRGGEGWLALLPVEARKKPGDYTAQVVDRRGRTLGSQSFTVLNGGFPEQNIRVSRRMRSLRPLPGERETIQALIRRVSPERYWQDPFVSPTRDCMNSLFGVRRLYNGKFTGNYHRGVDLRSPQVLPVHATAAGIVRISKMYRLNGGTVGIDHGQGVVSIYIHMSRLIAKQGQKVLAGEVIGEVGSTGFATGPHLHWGLYVAEVPVNPNQWTGEVGQCE